MHACVCIASHQVLAGTCIVAQSLLDMLQEAAVAAARAEADAAIAERRKTGASATSSGAAPGVKKTVSFSVGSPS
jgi:hypothetical protein